jgi:hypothetical protein
MILRPLAWMKKGGGRCGWLTHVKVPGQPWVRTRASGRTALVCDWADLQPALHVTYCTEYQASWIGYTSAHGVKKGRGPRVAARQTASKQKSERGEKRQQERRFPPSLLHSVPAVLPSPDESPVQSKKRRTVEEIGCSPSAGSCSHNSTRLPTPVSPLRLRRLVSLPTLRSLPSRLLGADRPISRFERRKKKKKGKLRKPV